MAKIHSFRIRNSKGATDVEIKLDKRVSSPIVTLIGLNESGKTTILEALSYYVSGDIGTSGCYQTEW
ncbi:AAA family ATPase [Bradyrhizobium sp. CSS354]|uniref:AAA family ATPase n=1 Tax=Bradyrhizobium sp. CSS354 TaxID=2699172 RepID=UPI0023D0D11C|nr:AAA family ATPase [Bradyrhizobium sp. CSS354]